MQFVLTMDPSHEKQSVEVLMPFVLTMDLPHETQSSEVLMPFALIIVPAQKKQSVKSDAIYFNNGPVTRETIWSILMSFVLRMDPSYAKQSGEV